jgi:hypothetical protein
MELIQWLFLDEFKFETEDMSSSISSMSISHQAKCTQ